MRFMMLMIPGGYETAGADFRPSLEGIENMRKYNLELGDAGILRSLEGLHPPSSGARVSFKGGKPLVTDGPFAEVKEVVGGFWIIEVASLEEAIAWARRCPASENEMIEVRRVFDIEDFSTDVQEAVADLEREGR